MNRDKYDDFVVSINVLEDKIVADNFMLMTSKYNGNMQMHLDQCVINK